MQKRFSQRMTAKDFRDLMGVDCEGNIKTSKYHSQKTAEHASKKEEKRANELKLLAMIGEISDLREQVPFVVIPEQRDEMGVLRERAVKYIADFVYKDRKGRTVVEDTKGFKTREYIIKRKLMLKVYNIKVKEI